MECGPARRCGGRILGAALALMWLWTGIVCHGLYFLASDKAALGFAAFFVVQGIALACAGSMRAMGAAGPPGWAGAF